MKIFLQSLTLVMLNKDATPISNFQPIRLLDSGCWYKLTYLMPNSVDPDQLASTLFAKAGHIRVAGQGLTPPSAD